MARDAITVESSPTQILESLNSEQMHEYEKSGKLPDLPEAPPKEKVETAPADPSSAAKEPPAPEKVEAPAESAPAHQEPKPKGAEARIKELLAENKRLASELETSRKAPVAAPAKSEEPAKPHRNDVDEKTGLAKYATDEAYEEARDKWLTDKVTHDVEQRHAKAEKERTVAEQNKLIERRWQNSIKIATEKHPDFAKVLELDDKGAFNSAAVRSIKGGSVVDAWILESEIGGEILYYLAANPGEVERIGALNPFAAARELTKLEDKLSAPVTAPAPVKETKEEKAEGSPKPVVSNAPAPAATVGGKGTAPVDEIGAAVKDGNFSAYEREQNRLDVQKRKASK
jgi:hypothetical protein